MKSHDHENVAKSGIDTRQKNSCSQFLYRITGQMCDKKNDLPVVDV